jgi:hypothetical protein
MWNKLNKPTADSTTHFLTRFAGFLPGLAGLILGLHVSAVLGWIPAAIVWRVLASFHLTSVWEGGRFFVGRVVADEESNAS